MRRQAAQGQQGGEDARREALAEGQHEVEGLRGELAATGALSQGVAGNTPLERFDAIESELRRLTSKTEELEFRVNRIVSDLTSPKKALRNAENGLGYTLYSLSEDEKPGDEVDPRLFLVRAEAYGVPQARHRMFIVGIRNDLDIRPARLRPHAPPTLRQTIGGLPALRSSLSASRTSELASWAFS